MTRALFSYGFRPFFALSAAWAVLTLVVLVGAFNLGTWPTGGLPLARWHGHEMLFGFVAAAIAGFLLTAVPTWTGSRALAGPPLVLLAALWLAGRAVMSPWLGTQGTAWMLVDAAFLPALALALGWPLVRARNYRNFQFLLFLGLLTVTDLVFLCTELGWLGPLGFDSLRLAANLVLLMVTVVGGRIIPLFTRNALLRAGMRSEIAPSAWLGQAALVAVTAVLAVDLLWPETPLAGWVAGAAGMLLALRLGRWQGHRARGMPIVWILHVGYAWLAVALVLKSAWLVGPAPWAANWLHALTAGGFGTMILAVMTRVALGHTGRELVVGKATTAAYVLVIAGAALRVAGPTSLPNSYVPLVSVAGAAWAAAFVIFLVVYAPVLAGPRPDQAGQ
jgi:uncharacterized protein involved in response to NO